MRYYDLELTPITGKTFLEQNEEGTRIPQSDDMVSIYFKSVDKVKYDRGFNEDGYPILIEYELLEDGTRATYYKDAVNNYKTIDTNAIEYNEAQTAAKIEYDWAVSELEALDIKINKTSDGEELEFSESYCRCMRKALRDYVNLSDGVYSTADLTDKTYTYASVTYSVVIEDGRPASLKAIES